MIKTATVFRHMLSDGPGTFSANLHRHNIQMSHVDCFADPLGDFDPLGPDLLIVMGGSCGVYQADLYPFLKDEMRILKTRIEADRPTIGICLGAQMIAGAMGAKNYIGPQGTEIGWYEIDVNQAGQNTPVRHFDKEHTHIMQWHGDTFDLPDGATLLASNKNYQNQIIGFGKHVLGFQCHIEVNPRMLQSWFVSAAHNIHMGKIDLQKMQEDTAKYANGMISQTEKFFDDWLDMIAKTA